MFAHFDPQHAASRVGWRATAVLLGTAMATVSFSACSGGDNSTASYPTATVTETETEYHPAAYTSVPAEEESLYPGPTSVPTAAPSVTEAGEHEAGKRLLSWLKRNGVTSESTDLDWQLAIVRYVCTKPKGAWANYSAASRLFDTHSRRNVVVTPSTDPGKLVPSYSTLAKAMQAFPSCDTAILQETQPKR